jgi:putative transposase
MEYESKAHSKFLLLSHLIFVCKYRKKLSSDPRDDAYVEAITSFPAGNTYLIRYGDETKRIVEDSATRSDFSFEAMEVGQDHIHYLVKSEPRLSPLAIVRRLKQESTVRLWRAHERELQRHFWKERTFWSDGYFCCTIGNASQETIRQYIESQG